MNPGMPSPSGHCVVVDDEPGPDGFAVHCIPHGRLGAWEDRLAALVAAYTHDVENGGDTL